jgi:hypothetical protein
MSLTIRRFAYTAWDTRLHISLGVTGRAPPKRARRRSRGPPLPTHVRLSHLPDHQRLMPTQLVPLLQRRPLGVHVPLYLSLLFRPPPPVLFDRELTYPLSTAHHFNDFDY